MMNIFIFQFVCTPPAESAVQYICEVRQPIYRLQVFMNHTYGFETGASKGSEKALSYCYYCFFLLFLF